ncbi:Regulatory protein PchR [Pandoraea iniqua]|uniref:Regulatory protein PchR n=1 Tax=Pandoraea iniqua TaxID=2508288 RepID=A0A5E4UV23_9BURK|nr:AraC family transcriptional regulator [Pandoraea iniqua]VVE02909.1 Regulatory protein PchR [Pandoraea iniqua]
MCTGTPRAHLDQHDLQIPHALQPWRRSFDLDGLSLSQGVQHASAGESVRESLTAGDIKIVFLLDGTLQWGACGEPLLTAGAASVNVCFGAASFDIDNVYRHAGALRYCSLRLSEDYLRATCGLDANALTHRWRDAAHGAGHPSHRNEARAMGDWAGDSAVLTRAMSADEWRWANAMASTPETGDASNASMMASSPDTDTPWQRLALVAQTFEALARCAAFQPNTAMPASGESARQATLRKALLAARDLLDEQLQTPPSLPQLARTVGINVNKLCEGFREQFGTTVHGYVRERRLTQAYALLSARRISVSEAAWQCGYTDSHFSKTFRARFGMLPHTLTREGVSPYS